MSFQEESEVMDIAEDEGDMMAELQSRRNETLKQVFRKFLCLLMKAI